jgi:nicotinamidase-related amidase
MGRPTKHIAPSLLEPHNHALILIDQQYLQLLTMRSHDATIVVNAMALLAKGAKLFGVKTLLTTAFAERQAPVKEGRTWPLWPTITVRCW